MLSERCLSECESRHLEGLGLQDACSGLELDTNDSTAEDFVACSAQIGIEQLKLVSKWEFLNELKIQNHQNQLLNSRTVSGMKL